MSFSAHADAKGIMQLVFIALVTISNQNKYVQLTTFFRYLIVNHQT